MTTDPVDLLICGFPGKSTCHGGMGWSSVVLIRSGARVALVDAGNFGMRKPIIEQLASRGLKPADVTDLLLTHSHYDHSVNWTLFRHARIVVGATEMACAEGALGRDARAGALCARPRRLGDLREGRGTVRRSFPA